MNVIETVNLTRKFQQFYAVNNVSIKIKKGEIYGLIGLNGAGKTTLFRMLLGLVKSTSGVCYINGDKVSRTSTHLWSKVGHIVETPYSYPELTVSEVLHIQRRLYGIEDVNVVEKIIEEFHLTKYVHVKAKNLSLGNLQRLGIAKALINRPEILILDEPVNGLDPQGIVDMRQYLKKLAEEYRVTILISSHLLSEVAKMATMIGIIHEGVLIEEVDVETLYERLNERLVINTNNNQEAIKVLGSSGLVAMRNDEGTIEIQNKEAILHPEKISLLLVENGLDLLHISIMEEDLEAYFLRLIQDKEEIHHDIFS